MKETGRNEEEDMTEETFSWNICLLLELVMSSLMKIYRIFLPPILIQFEVYGLISI